MDNEEEYYNIQLQLTDEMWQYYEHSDKFDIIEKNQNKNKEKILLLISSLSLLDGEDKLNKVKEISYSITDMFKFENSLESEYLNDILKNVVNDSYDINNFIMKLGNSKFKTSKILTEDVKKIVEEKIQDKTNINRISNNKTNIKKQIIDNINLFAEGFITLSLLKNIVENILKTNLDMSKTMFSNEIHRCTDRSYSKWNYDNDIERFMYVSLLENNTCNECREDHGKVFRKTDADIIDLPRHVHCKCFYVPIPNLNWNNDFGKVNFENFKKWRNLNEN